VDICEEDMIIACGLYLLLEKEEKLEKRYAGFSMCSEQENRKENFTFCLDACKMTKFFKCFRMGFSKYEYLKHLLHIDIEKKSTR